MDAAAGWRQGLHSDLWTQRTFAQTLLIDFTANFCWTESNEKSERFFAVANKDSGTISLFHNAMVPSWYAISPMAWAVRGVLSKEDIADPWLNRRRLVVQQGDYLLYVYYFYFHHSNIMNIKNRKIQSIIEKTFCHLSDRQHFINRCITSTHHYKQTSGMCLSCL